MNNYKIKVNNEAESKEVQELFFELGAVWGQSKTATLNLEPMSFIYFNGSSIYYGHDDENDDYWFQVEESGKEITLPQLRDLVVLHRNDVKDATHIDKYGTSHVDINGQWFFWSNNNDDEIIDYGWNESASSRESDNRALEPIKPIQEPGLISGAEQTIKVNGLDFLIEGKDALRSALDGNDIQLSLEPWEVNSWSDFNPTEDEASTKAFFTGLSSDGQKVFFRLKPRTIKLELEIPAPMNRQPKVGERCCYIDFGLASGYQYLVWEEDFSDFIDLWWNLESNAEQAVAAMRGIKG